MNDKIIFFVLSLAFFVRAQNFNTWKNYTDESNVNAFAIDGGGVWCATSGGSFYFDERDSSFEVFTKSEGLKSQKLTSVAIDNQGKVWFGSEEGYLNIYNPADGSIRIIGDIFNSDKIRKGINFLKVKGDTVLVCTDFGISTINSKDYSFIETIVKLGNFNADVKATNLNISRGKYLAATEAGAAIANVSVKNLSAPESWDVYSLKLFYPASKVNKLIYFNNELLAATNKGVFKYDNGKWAQFIFAGQKVKDFFVNASALYLLVNNSIYKFENGTETLIKTFKNTTLVSFNKNGNNIYIASSGGLILLDDSANYYFPNGPVGNSFNKLAVDKSQRLWLVSGNDPTGPGINMFDGSTWFNFNSTNTNEIHNNAFYSVFTADNGKIYFANWGDGVTVYDNGKFFTYNADNTSLTGIEKNPRFIPITDVALDGNGNMWILNLQNVDGKSVSVLTAENKWYHYKFGYPLSPSPAELYNLVIDQYGTKWFYVSAEGEPGLYYFNENGTFDDLKDDVWGILNSQDGLNSDNIKAIALDNQGELWVGTSLGVNIIPDPRNPSSNISSVFALRQQSITCIAVDPLNQKWVGTNQGVFLMSPDGSALLAQYNKDNSPLASNKINSIVIDPKSGIAFIATDLGLSSLTTFSVQPENSFSNVFVYPNPFVIREGADNKVYFDKLIRNSRITILTVSGAFVREITTPGGRVGFWDGRDVQGNLVPSGVYIVVAYDEEANNVAVTKVAVIRK